MKSLREGWGTTCPQTVYQPGAPGDTVQGRRAERSPRGPLATNEADQHERGAVVAGEQCEQAECGESLAGSHGKTNCHSPKGSRFAAPAWPCRGRCRLAARRGCFRAVAIRISPIFRHFSRHTLPAARK